MLSKDLEVRSIADWQRAPRDGSLICVEFPDGEIRQARWDAITRQWQLPHPDGNLVPMHYERNDIPQDWWPVL